MSKLPIIFLVLMIAFLPMFAFAQDEGIVPCVGGVPATDSQGNPLVDGQGNQVDSEGNIVCTFSKLIELGKKFNDFIIIVSLPVATIAFAYAGSLLLFGGGKEDKRTQAKSIFKNAFIGLILVFGAWLLVFLVTDFLLSEDVTRDFDPLNVSQQSPTE